MRLTVRGEQHLHYTEVVHESAPDAVSEALGLLSAGMSVVYIYDDATDRTLWPDEFDKLASLIKEYGRGYRHPDAS